MPVIVDTGPLVALLNRRDAHHDWAVAQFGDLPAPLLTCEAVLAESCHLVRHLSGGVEAVLQLATSGTVQIEFSASSNLAELRALAARYDDVPMSFADACLVRMSELHSDCRVFTIDSDFRVYRRRGRRTIPLIAPSPGRPRGVGAWLRR